MLRTAPRALSQTGNSPKCHQVVPILRNLTTTKPVAGRVAPKNSLQGLPAPSSSVGLSYRQYSNSFGLRPPDKKPWNPKDNRFNHEKTSRFTGKVTPQENDNEPDEIIERDHLDDISKDPVPHLLSQEERSHLPEPTHIAPEATSTLEISNLLAVAMRTDIQGWCRSAGLRLLDDRFPPDYPSYCRLRFASVEEAVKAKSFLSEKPIFDGEPAISFFIEKSKSTRFMCIPDFKGTLESLNQAVAQVAEAEVHLVPVEDMGKLRMDAYLKFSSLTDADRAFQYLRRHQFEDGVFAQNIESIEPSRYTAVVSPSDAGRSMSDFVTTPPRRDEDGIGRSAPSVPSGPSTTIWMGNIPLELLEQRAEILDKFSKYGEIHELRIPRAQAGPRGCMWIEYQKQPSADAAYRDLMANPLILYGRPTKVDYAEPRQVREGSQMLRSTNSVCIRGVEPRIAQDRLTLSRMLETFGDVVDIRIRECIL
ncbi:hypothetical protein FRC17_002883 [Serendipita sp. 399]|nr:hypothetical protein FRC17_002883 [Serendipita sp. 399]